MTQIKIRTEWQARHAAERYELLIEPLRVAARRHGYALAVHGSLKRDIDLIAVPWTEEASDTDFLVASLMGVIERINPNGCFVRRDDPDWPHSTPGDHNPAKRPHGRLTWALHLGPTYIDLSVMPIMRECP